MNEEIRRLNMILIATIFLTAVISITNPFMSWWLIVWIVFVIVINKVSSSMDAKHLKLGYETMINDDRLNRDLVPQLIISFESIDNRSAYQQGKLNALYEIRGRK